MQREGGFLPGRDLALALLGLRSRVKSFPLAAIVCNFALFRLGRHGSGLVFGGLPGREGEVGRRLAQVSVELLVGGSTQARFTVAGGSRG